LLLLFRFSSCTRICSKSGTDVIIFKTIFAERFGKKSAFFVQKTAEFCKNWIVPLVFQKNVSFFRRKLAKIVNKTSTPGLKTVKILFSEILDVQFLRKSNCLFNKQTIQFMFWLDTFNILTHLIPGCFRYHFWCSVMWTAHSRCQRVVCRKVLHKLVFVRQHEFSIVKLSQVLQPNFFPKTFLQLFCFFFQ
jgi:hypothetical protein